jgi:hypothetical protein
MKKNKTQRMIEKWVKTLIDENGLTLETVTEAYMIGVIDGAIDQKYAGDVMKLIGKQIEKVKKI